MRSGLNVRVWFAGPWFAHSAHSEVMSGWLECERRIRGRGTGVVHGDILVTGTRYSRLGGCVDARSCLRGRCGRDCTRRRVGVGRCDCGGRAENEDHVEAEEAARLRAGRLRFVSRRAISGVLGGDGQGPGVTQLAFRLDDSPSPSDSLSACSSMSVTSSTLITSSVGLISCFLAELSVPSPWTT